MGITINLFIYFSPSQVKTFVCLKIYFQFYIFFGEKGKPRDMKNAASALCKPS